MNDINLFEEIEKNCRPYITLLQQTKYKILVRGYNDPIADIKEFKHNIQYRVPRNTPQNIHDRLNEKFESVFGWKIRNGVFCFGIDFDNNIKYNLGYGDNYFFFPQGEFEFVYSRNVFDLYEYFNEIGGTIEDKLKNIKFESNDFDLATHIPVDSDYSNEISLKVNDYYLVNMNLREQVKELIWGKAKP